MIAVQGMLALPPGGVPPWEAKNLFYTDAAIVEHTMQPQLGERMVTTSEELEQVLELSEQSNTQIRIWVHEGLEEIVKRLF